MMTIRGIYKGFKGYHSSSIRVGPFLDPVTEAEVVPDPGDTMVVFVSAVMRNDGTGLGPVNMLGPDDWTLFEASPGAWGGGYGGPTIVRQWGYAKIAGPDEPETYLFRDEAASASYPIAVMAVLLDGTSEVNAAESNAQQSGSGWNISQVPAITTTSAGCTVLISMALFDIEDGLTQVISDLSAGDIEDAQAAWHLYTAWASLDAPDAGAISGITYRFPGNLAVMGSANIIVALLPTATGVTVVVTPATATVVQETTKQFTTTVYGVPTQDVTWSVVEGGGGSIDANGLYTAPATPGTYTVRATSDDTPTAYGEAIVTVIASGTVLSGILWYQREGT